MSAIAFNGEIFDKNDGAGKNKNATDRSFCNNGYNNFDINQLNKLSNLDHSSK